MIWDNGENLLGRVLDVKKYLLDHVEEDAVQDVAEILRDLDSEKNDSMIDLYYNNPMGYSYDIFSNDAIVEDTKEPEIIREYEDVFEDAVKCRAEDTNTEISKSDAQIIAHKLIYDNEYIWEIINETIDLLIEKR